MTPATLIAAAASLALLGGWLWWLADRRDEAVPADEDDDPLAAEVSETTPAEDGRLRLQAFRTADRLALDALLSTPTRTDLRPWYQEEKKTPSRQAAPAPTAGPGGQREP